MEKGKKHLSEFMKNNKEKWHDWLFLHPGIACLLTYGGLFLVVITAGYIVFTQFNLFQTEPNSAAYCIRIFAASC
jgi:hypothetical protein